ncbi:hypothetical protein [Wenzhouxiangella marina]|uniref:Uncharacterized protein n=1 Tax=Wenzhouxiangella marina TaxID=1579979 RepID=A0A0K0XWS2_9GAMM|nr:hypothetical protein [Wenzhouxiangella marina]AKS42128.1 hypothetical protein WM2015_1761 [Wenzhouxiangella marina]MBB6086100.1 hypothetical protein [Wenzhouxiangella marina]
MKALFFLRHYNDIDHVTPIVYKWVQAGHVADLVMMGARSSVNDYRIRFLDGHESVRVAWIGDIVGRAKLFRMGLQKLLRNRYFRRALPGFLTPALDRAIGEDKRFAFWRKIGDLLLDRSFPDRQGEASMPGIVAFDWISGNSVFPIEFVQSVVASARERKLGAISLPHGDSPHASFMVRVEELDMKPRMKFEPAKMFDTVAVPNELCAKRFRPFLDDRRVAVLGSPRYCDEWLARLETLLPPSPLQADDTKFKVVFFSRKEDFSIFWEEVARAVRIWASFPDVELIIKAHTRGGWRQPLSRQLGLRKLDNVRFVAGEVHSSHLLDWADAAIDLGTSVVFEAVKRKLPVLSADYLQAARLTIGEYLPECALTCRDDAYQKLERLLENGPEDFYVPAHRERFLREVIDVPDPEVLPRYVEKMESLAR